MLLRSLIVLWVIGCYWFKVIQKVENTVHVPVRIIPCINIKTTEKIFDYNHYDFMFHVYLFTVFCQAQRINMITQMVIIDYFVGLKLIWGSVVADALHCCTHTGLNSNSFMIQLKRQSRSPHQTDHWLWFKFSTDLWRIFECGPLLNLIFDLWPVNSFLLEYNYTSLSSNAVFNSVMMSSGSQVLLSELNTHM